MSLQIKLHKNKYDINQEIVCCFFHRRNKMLQMKTKIKSQIIDVIVKIIMLINAKGMFFHEIYS